MREGDKMDVRAQFNSHIGGEGNAAIGYAIADKATDACAPSTPEAPTVGDSINERLAYHNREISELVQMRDNCPPWLLNQPAHYVRKLLRY